MFDRRQRETTEIKSSELIQVSNECKCILEQDLTSAVGILNAGLPFLNI